jgi:hypothetical protein
VHGRSNPAGSGAEPVQPSLQKTPEELREVVLALFDREDSTRAFGRSMIARGQAARDFPDEMGNRFTYGEFDLDFFTTLLALAKPRAGEIFCDLGSGCGRLVIAAALSGYGFSNAIGIELLDELHKLAAGSLRTLEPIIATTDELDLSPCEFFAGDGNELIAQLVQQVEDEAARPTWTIFSYTTCMPSVGPYLCELSASLGAILPVGSRVITTDKQLISDDHGRWDFRLLHQLEAPNYGTWTSTGFVFELVAQNPNALVDGADGDGGVGGGGGGSRSSTGSPMVSRRALMTSALALGPLAAARRARAADVTVERGDERDVGFRSRSLGLGLTDIQTTGGARISVNRIVDGSEAKRSGVRVGSFLKAVGGKPLSPTARAQDVRQMLADAPRPVTITFQGALAPDLAVESAAKARGAETERFKIDRTKEPAPNCGIRSRKGDTIEIHYEARLGDETRRLIDSSYERGIGAPFALQLGNGDVPRALELGIYDMCIGEARRIVAPPRLAYGMGGNKMMGVPPNSTVVWDVSMEAINFQSDPAMRREDTGMALTPWE